MDHVITVSEQDEATGTEEKLKAHEDGTLHRAFSVFVFNDKHELLLQQRATSKYHSGGMWTNTCCSHPAPGEDTLAAAHRRLQEEMGFDCPLQYLQPFRYRADMTNGLIENEYDHLYTGIYNAAVHPNPDEVQAIKFLSLDAIREWIDNEPEAFTAWFKMIFPKLMDLHILQINNLDQGQKEQVLQLWNEEYPAALNYKDMQAFEEYVDQLNTPTHYLLQDQSHRIIGWAFKFVRDDACWFGIMLNSKLHGKGYGAALLNALKHDATELNGWVTAHNNDLKRDGSCYQSPVKFYLRNGFELLPDVRLNIGELSWVKMAWHADGDYHIRRFTVNDAAAYKAVRLEALQTEPGMFGISHARESSFPENHWTDRLLNPGIATFGLYYHTELIGITSVLTNNEKPDEAYMTQSYIRKAHRGKGLSQMLYDARLAFAKARGIKKLTIGHRESNGASFSANQKHGFVFTHREPRQWPDGGNEDMLYYELSLD